MSVDALLNAYAAKNTDNRAHPIAAPYVPRWQDKYAIPDWQTRLTRLSPEEEMAFMEWAKKNRVPITPDYDMRGFWKAKGVSSVNQASNASRESVLQALMGLGIAERVASEALDSVLSGSPSVTRDQLLREALAALGSAKAARS